MSEVTHTPGPWSVEAPMVDEFWIVQKGLKPHEWTPIAQVGADDSLDAMDRGASRPITKREATANARLIAAAPDLYAALKEWAENPDGWNVDQVNHARAVIAKVEA